MKILKQIAVFLICFGIFYSLAFYRLYQKSGNDFLIKKLDSKTPVNRTLFERTLDSAQKLNHVNLLFVGSSHCYRGLDPSIFEEYGHSAFNLGSSSQTPANTLGLLQKYIHLCDTVILETYPVVFGIGPLESYIDIYAATGDAKLLFSEALTTNSFRAFNLLLQKPFNRNALLKDSLRNCLFHQGFTTVLDSAIRRNVKYKPVTLNKVEVAQQFGYLEKIYDLCRNQNKTLVLVYAPVPKQLKIINEPLYQKEMILFCQSHPNLKFYNYGRHHSLSDGYHFYDDDHLNATGVRLFNEMFIKDLKK